MSISNGTMVYLFTDTPTAIISGGEPTNKNYNLQGVENIQDYYGDLAQKQKDLIFQPASLIGTASGEKQVFNGSVYYQILVKNRVDKRTSNGWGAGTYVKVDWLGWVKAEDLTDSEEAAYAKYEKRTDTATKERVKTANQLEQSDVNSLPKSKIDKTNLQQEKTPVVKKSNTTLYVIIGVAVVVVIGVIVYIKTQKQPQQTHIQPQQVVYT